MIVLKKDVKKMRLTTITQFSRELLKKGKNGGKKSKMAGPFKKIILKS